MAGRVPRVYVILCLTRPGSQENIHKETINHSKKSIQYWPCHRHEGLSIYPRVSRLVECSYLHLEARIFPVKYWFWWKISFEEIWRFETNLMIFIVSSSVLKEFIRTRGTLESYLEFHIYWFILIYWFTITQGKMKKYENVFKVCTFCSGILSAGQSGLERWDHFGPGGITNIIQQRETYNVQQSLIFYMCIMLPKNTTVTQFVFLSPVWLTLDHCTPYLYPGLHWAATKCWAI